MRIEVRAGTLNIFRGAVPYRAMVQPRDTRQHENYDKETLRNDIGLVYLQNPIRFNTLMQPIPLPTRPQASSTFVGESPTVVGWGRFSDSEYFFYCL